MASKTVIALAAFTTASLLAEIGRRSTDQENASKRFQRVLSAINGPVAPKGRPATPVADAAPAVLGPDGQPVRRRGRPPGSKNKAPAATVAPATVVPTA